MKICLICGYVPNCPCRYCEELIPFDQHICQPELPFTEEIEYNGEEV